MGKKFNQLCVWQNVTIGEGSADDFASFMNTTFGARVKYMEEVLTLPTPGVEGTGGRSDLFFYIHDDDITKFAVPRLQYGIRWWEDVLGNGGGVLYTQDILDKYPKTW
jgi:hypothetical protein